MLATRIFRRDLGGTASAMGALLLPMAAALASLGEGMGPAVMSASLLSAAASLLGILSAVEGVMDDREGWISPLIVSLGRRKYAVLRTAVSISVSAAAAAPALAFYALLKPASAAPAAVATLFSASAGSSLGVLIGLAAPTRGYAYAWGVSAWTALALVYEVVMTFISLYFPVSEVAVAASLLANPLVAARLSGVVQADPHLLTLGAVGDHLYKSLGTHAPLLFPAVAVAWIFATSAAAVLAASRRDL